MKRHKGPKDTTEVLILKYKINRFTLLVGQQAEEKQFFKNKIK